MSTYSLAAGRTGVVLQENSTGLFLAMPQEVKNRVYELNFMSSFKAAANYIQEQIFKAPAWLVKAERFSSVDEMPLDEEV